MSTIPEMAPPASPPAAFTGGGGGGGGGGHQVKVTRNVPPKRVMVNRGATIVVGGKSYTEGDTLLLQGPEADEMALPGIDGSPPHVVIVSHEEIDAWNGKEGREQAKAILDVVDKNHAASGTERSHDHGTGKYTHADKDGIEVDVTNHRQRLAAEHMNDPTKPDTMSDDQAGPTGGKE